MVVRRVIGAEQELRLGRCVVEKVVHSDCCVSYLSIIRTCVAIFHNTYADHHAKIRNTAS
ncbi:hypothetical protein E2C01_027951 [Portunus trituberculatus]|uniref:Uncharacterized protein n=1 Tax=Portunus trituberculatus TaxID=210409 RepID=A0A5B7EN11_PORTR|nr:hypothetical protein [Portunus trituberculatus]